jgi:hypothetical protein
MKANGLRNGGRSIKFSTTRLAIALDDDLAITVVIAVTIMTAPDHNSIVAIPILALADHFTVAITITVAMPVADGNTDATRANTDADFFSSRRHCERNSSHRDGSY